MGFGKRVLGLVFCVLLVGTLGCGDDSSSDYEAGDGDGSGSGGAGGGDGDGTGSGGGGGGDGDGSGSGGAGGGDGDGVGTSEPIVKPEKFFAGDDPDRNRVTPGKICERLSTIQCAGEAWCCDGRTRTEASCKATMLAGCRDDLLLDPIAMDPIVGFDADHAFVAFTKFEEMAAACDPSIATFGASREGLLGMQNGTVAAGASCKPPSTIPTSTQGGAALAACADPDTFACLPGLTSWECDPRGNAGADCFADSNCVGGLFCDNPKLSIAGDVCQARKANGMPCTGDNHCQTLTCRGGSCVEATSQTAYCLQ